MSPIGSAPATNSSVAPKIVFGGIKHDSQQVRDSLHHLTNPNENSESAIRNVGAIVGGAIDSPLSLVGDTLTLPVTVPAAIDRAVNAYYFPEGRHEKVEERQPTSDDSENPD